jgi:hypothetical protein
MSDNKVIGYIALLNNGKALANKNAYIIAGSEEDMKVYISKLSTRKAKEFTIRKIRSAEILQRLSQGLHFVFDGVACQRFSPVALKAGMEIDQEQCPDSSLANLHFMRVGIPKS